MSYVAVWRNAVAASCCLAARSKPPPRTASRTAGYSEGSVITATEPWFLALARTIAGPPMSICSIASGGVAPSRTVSANG